MAKKAVFSPKPPVVKLPLAVRKDIRDNYDSKKGEYETEISELLGTKFVINIDAPAVWAYSGDSGATSGTASAGTIFAGYVEGFISGLKSFLGTYTDEGKAYFNKTVTQSELTIAVNELGDDGDTITADIKDGVFRILFKHTSLGYNQSWLDSSYFVRAIDAVPQEEFTLKVTHSIESGYNEVIEDLTTAIGKILAIPDIILDPNFKENYASLESLPNKDWQQSFGNAAFAYFSDGLKYQLERQGFKDDDLLQEGFAEVITSKTIKLKIVEKTKSGYGNESIIEDGVLLLTTTAERWYSNVYDMGQGIIDLL